MLNDLNKEYARLLAQAEKTSNRKEAIDILHASESIRNLITMVEQRMAYRI